MSRSFQIMPRHAAVLESVLHNGGDLHLRVNFTGHAEGNPLQKTEVSLKDDEPDWIGDRVESALREAGLLIEQ